MPQAMRLLRLHLHLRDFSPTIPFMNLTDHFNLAGLEVHIECRKKGIAIHQLKETLLCPEALF